MCSYRGGARLFSEAGAKVGAAIWLCAGASGHVSPPGERCNRPESSIQTGARPLCARFIAFPASVFHPQSIHARNGLPVASALDSNAVCHDESAPRPEKHIKRILVRPPFCTPLSLIYRARPACDEHAARPGSTWVRLVCMRELADAFQWELEHDATAV